MIRKNDLNRLKKLKETEDNLHTKWMKAKANTDAAVSELQKELKQIGIHIIQLR